MKKGIHGITVVGIIAFIAVMLLIFGAMTLDLTKIPFIGQLFG